MKPLIDVHRLSFRPFWKVWWQRRADPNHILHAEDFVDGILSPILKQMVNSYYTMGELV